MDWQNLKKCIRYSRVNFPFLRLVLSTNGLLLDSAKFEFLKKYDVNIFLTIDGPPSIHDKHRKLKGTNEGSLDRILDNIKQISLEDRRNITINTVISPDSCQELTECLLFIRGFGFINIRFYPVFQQLRWHDQDIVNFSTAMKIFAKKYCNLFLTKDIDKIFVITILKDFLKKKLVKKNNVYCLEGRLEDCQTVWLDCRGNFYICEKIIGMKSDIKRKYKIGNVRNGINFSLRESLLSEAGKNFRRALVRTNLKERDCFFCPFSFYFQKIPFSFYFKIMNIYKETFYNILSTLKNNNLFRKIYHLGLLS